MVPGTTNLANLRRQVGWRNLPVLVERSSSPARQPYVELGQLKRLLKTFLFCGCGAL